MKKHLNTIYINTDNTWLSKEGDTIKVSLKGETLIRIPLHNIQSIITFGWDILMSPQLMEACLKDGVTVTFCNPYGKFLASLQGHLKGNVLLRRAQYRIADHPDQYILISREMIAAKIANARTLLQRAARTYTLDETLEKTINLLTTYIQQVRKCLNPDELRGHEGAAADLYFTSLPHCISTTSEKIKFNGRSKRPPLDPVNALLSFLYTILHHDARSALTTVGLDADVGLLHRDRPGRHSLALDLMEEFRAPLADRMALTLINRKQIKNNDFDYQENGAVLLKEDSRKIVLQAWQERKNDIIEHPVLEEKTTLGLLLTIQAQILAKAIRGESDGYIPFIWK